MAGGSKDESGNISRTIRQTLRSRRTRELRNWYFNLIFELFVFFLIFLGFLELNQWMGYDDSSWVGFIVGRDSNSNGVGQNSIGVWEICEHIARLEKYFETVSNELGYKLEMREAEVKLLRKSEFQNLILEETFFELYEEYLRERMMNETNVSDNNIIDVAKTVVATEIDRHSADGLGMVDYAVVSGGGKVLEHSEKHEFYPGPRFEDLIMRMRSYKVSPEVMLSPSFGQPGECFPLKSEGFVQISLITEIFPEAVTLEHVDKDVIYDRSDAPKNCLVFGWLKSQFPSNADIKWEKFLLAVFTYDLEKSHVQTFKVEESGTSRRIDTVRMNFLSNHGANHTCIYRVRVHGRTSVPMSEDGD